MLRRLTVTAAVGLICLFLLFLENKCSSFLGTQEVQAEVKATEAEAEAAKPDAAAGKEAEKKQQHYDVVFKDVAGNVLQTTQSDLDEVKRRLGGNPRRELQPIKTVGEPADSGLKITVTVDPSVKESDLRARLQSVPFRRPNPPRELFHLTQGIDLRGGVEFICRLHSDDGRQIAADDEVVHTLRNRLDERGLTEPSVARLSNGDVQVVIPGGTRADAARTRKVLETTGRLEFRHVIDPFVDGSGAGRGSYYITVSPTDPNPAVVKNEKGQWDIAPGHDELKKRNRSEIIAPDHVSAGEPPTKFYLLSRADLVGSDVANAYETTDNGQPAVGIEFTAVGAVKNEEFTKSAKEEDTNKTGTGEIAILFDGVVRSAPKVISPSSSSCQISGQFSHEEIEALREVLRGGSLAVTPVVLSERVVGATLGEQTVSRSVITMGVSFALIVFFMWIYYRRLGTVANLCLIATTFFVWSTLSIFGATVTLPGLAGLVLIIGMAVDTNILIFERIREELREDKGLKAAISAGYDRAFLTIVDAHLTTFITAFILYWIGSGPVKGFGLTLMIGIVVNLFSGVYIGRLLTDWLCRKKVTVSMASWVPTVQLPYVEWRWVGYVFSIVTGLVGLGWFLFGHHVVGGTFERNFDIDFTGGNAAQVVLKEPYTLGQVEQAIAKAYESDPKNLNLLDPRELRKQPYFAELGGNHAASREWVFRSRDEEGGQIESKRSELEKTRADLQRQAEEAREKDGLQSAEAKEIQSKQIVPLDLQIRKLSEDISNRSEAFKEQIAKAFTGVVGQEGDEILAASFSGRTITLRLAVLEPVKGDQLAGITDRLAASNKLEKVVPTYVDEPHALELTATFRARPDARADAAEIASDRVAARLRDLFAKSTTELVSPSELNGLVVAAEDLYNTTSNAAAARRVTIAKPFPSSEHFSGQVAGQMKWRAFFAIMLSLLAILAYVAARFEFRFGIGAVVALFHDVLLTVGLISMLGIRIDLTVIAALLTIIGYSINDTIVTFDRIRENLRKMSKSLAEIIDISIAQTMPRTVLTSSTVIVTVVVLLLFGGDALKAFTATLLIGLLSGTYSSVFVASPLLLSFKGRIVDTTAPTDGETPAITGGEPVAVEPDQKN